jgi:putative transposase
MLVNQKIVSVGAKRKFVELLIVDFDEDNGLIAVSDLDRKVPKRPKVYKIEYVLGKIKRKEWQIEEHDFPESLYCKSSSLASKPKKTKSRDPIKMHSEAVECLKPLVENPEKLHAYLFGDSKGILRELEDKSGKSRKYVTGNLNRYFFYGGTNEALLPRYFECGKFHVLQEKPTYLEDGNPDLTSKPGINTVYGDAYRHVTQWDVENIKSFVKTEVKNGQEYVLSTLYDDFIGKYYTFKVKPTGAAKTDIAEPFSMVLGRQHLISPRAFMRQIKKIVSDLVWLKKKVGIKNYLRDNQAKPGSAHHGLRGPTSRYEIDSTVLDVYVRYEYSNEDYSIGRPIVYMVVDVVTGMRVGVHVAFHGPDWTGASQALLNAFSDKKEFCAKFGYDLKDGEWPCQEVCQQLTGDRGSENSDRNLESVLKGQIGLSVVNLNAYHMGSAKGTVEKSFDTLQSKTLTPTAGKVEKVKKFDEQHASRKQIYTYKSLVRQIIKCIILSNNSTKRVNGRTFEMERDGVDFTSLDAWNYGLKNRVITRQVSQQRLIYALLPEDNAVIQGKGVLYKNLYYNSKEFERLGLMDEAKNFGRKKIKIRYTDVSTNSIWWRDDEKKKLYKLDLTDRSQAFKNQTWLNVMHRIEFIKHELALLDERNHFDKVLFRMDLRSQERLLKRLKRQIKTSRAKSPTLGTKENGALMGDQQKYGYHQVQQAAFATTQSPQSTIRYSIDATWANPNAVPLKEDENV